MHFLHPNIQMERPAMICSAILLAFFLRLSSPQPITHSILDHGAMPDGSTDSALNILAAWNKACGSGVPAVVAVPPGTFLVSQVVLQGPCKSSKVTIEVKGTVVAPSSYTSAEAWIMFKDVNGLVINGGVFDGRGRAIWDCKNGGNHCPVGATSLKFEYSSDIWLNQVSSVNSEQFHILFYNSKRVLLTGAKVFAPADSPNTDGIHIQGSSDVTVINSKIGTGDDCISIGPGAANVWIEEIDCGPGHGISIGSLGSEEEQKGVKNVTAKGIEFAGTQNGFRIKTWAKPSNGFVQQVRFENAIMTDVKNPIVINQYYCPNGENCPSPSQSSGIQISDVVFKDVRGSSATEVAVNLNCSESNPCRDIWLENINLSCDHASQAQMACSYVNGGSQGSNSPPCCI